MNNGKTIGIAISGDPKRQPLANALFEIYSSYYFIDQVRLYYRKNPAIAFNAGAQDLDTDLFVGIAGDLYIGENELWQFLLCDPEKIICNLSPLTPRRRDVIPYPKPWESKEWAFTSGLFRCERQILLDHPFPTWPPFCEDYLWERILKPLGVQFIAIQVPSIHIDYHYLIRGRTIVYLSVPGRFVGKTFRENLIQVLKMFGWEWQEVWSAIRMKENPKERSFDEIF